MKRLIILTMLLCGMFVFNAYAAKIQLVPVDESGASNNSTKTPLLPITISVDGNIITMPLSVTDMTIQLLDEDGELAFTAFVPSGMTQVVLPTNLTGEYEIRLIPTGCYYYFSGFVLF